MGRAILSTKNATAPGERIALHVKRMVEVVRSEFQAEEEGTLRRLILRSVKNTMPLPRGRRPIRRVSKAYRLHITEKKPWPETRLEIFGPRPGRDQPLAQYEYDEDAERLKKAVDRRVERKRRPRKKGTITVQKVPVQS